MAKICDCFEKGHSNDYCKGTREKDWCSCGGDETKCDFYEHVRIRARGERKITRCTGGGPHNRERRYEVMERYTNYDELLKKWHDLGLDEISRIHKVNAFNHFIKNLPTADVEEVVRCKDCKYYSAVTHKGKPMHFGYCENKHDDIYGMRNRYERDFCSYGEKK